MLDVGHLIVGAPLERMSDEGLKTRAEASGVTSIGFVAEPSLEAIVALQSDTILAFTGGDSMASGLYPQLAPTLLYVSTDWRGLYVLLAAVRWRLGSGRKNPASQDRKFCRQCHRIEILLARLTEWRPIVTRYDIWRRTARLRHLHCCNRHILVVSTDPSDRRRPWPLRAGLRFSRWHR